jgi:hypothetical protein
MLKTRLVLAVLAIGAVTAACFPTQPPPPPQGQPPPPPQLLGDIVFDGTPGTSSPPATLGGFTMTPFGSDPRATGSIVSGTNGLGFSPSLELDRIGDGWGTWSHGYTGDVYWTRGATTLTLTLPANTGAFYFYVEPESFADFLITATAQDGTTGDATVSGFGGARYFGFYGVNGATVESNTVSSSEDFAVGEFGIAEAAGDQLESLTDVHAWFARTNIFDRVPVDIRAELLQNGAPVASGIVRCVGWDGIRPFVPRDVVVPWEPFDPVPIESGDVFTLRISARFGTTSEDEPCEPRTITIHGYVLPRRDLLRLFYDGVHTPSRFGIGITHEPASDRFLRSDGTPCGFHGSLYVTTRILEPDPSVDKFSKCQDSPVVGKDPANGWQEIGVWSLAPQP